MLASEKKFIKILDEMFIGVRVEKSDETLFNANVNHKAREKQGFVELLGAKSAYFNAFKEKFLSKINAKVGKNEELKMEIYDKLYDFFHRYFSPTGSVFYHQTPLFYNVYTKAYEKITSKDTELFYKTNMLYYVKSDKIYKSLTINLNDEQFIKFEVDEIGEKKGNQKAPIVFEFASATNTTLTLKASYSQKGRKTNLEELLKEAKKAGFGLDEETLKKALSAFNKQSSFDFFINKNAREFLSRELDLWIYQYLFSQKNSFEQERIKQIADFKELALELIEFIAKFEDELVKIWTKPRFVLNSHYLVSLSTLKEKGFDLEKIYKHKGFKAQKTHWQELGLKSDEGLFSNETLAIDTRFFEDLKEKIEELFNESELNGLLIKSENFQALNTLLPRFKSKIDLIYIDPPFNTENDEGFAYLDKFQDSTWLTLMQNRLELAKEFLSERGGFYLHLDHNANYYGRLLLNEIFGKENFRNEIVWHYGTYVGQTTKNFPRKHDNIMFYSKGDKSIFYMQRDSLLENDANYKRWKKYFNNNNQITGSNYPKDDSKFDGYVKRFVSENGREPIGETDIILDIDGKLVDSVWEIQSINPMSLEKISSNLTQKPEALLARIIKASSCAGGGGGG
ncbi:DNA methyltransferase, partial [Campylobacter helveticus]|uniref:DNA methyltransferase n=1 Tax=Campylobacter helveticus TaxID=28898 RepID=UPI0022EB533E